MPKGQAPRPRHGLDREQQIFVEHYLKNGKQNEAAAAAGRSQRWGTIVMQNPFVQEAIKEGRRFVQEKISYGLEESMREAEEAMAFAKETENANAYVKAIEHRAKLNGLLIEKIDLRQSGFQLVIGTQPGEQSILTTSRPVEALPAPESEEESEDVDIWS